ncbi:MULTISPECIES: hypothetical protein [Brachybacterium]|uniref:DUF222 domain-containing protein n=1 Tax=Brachybacterium kimchii TaxID=2942909 RepID=A0ABY4N7D4_9MICO|nr:MULTISPECIES: hypothetical protein [Brachybacterium]MCG7308289.1 hypothetical protein [Brachybacterium sp. ACRRE]UQN30468.1 hypothetical protein M4486_03760 [Brachybacterium kimchii]
MTTSGTSTLDPGTRSLDEQARRIGQLVVAGAVTPEDAACQILSVAVESDVVRFMCARHHRHLAQTWNVEEITSAVTTMLTQYALGSTEGRGHLDAKRFADGTTSASGWIGKVIGAMRTTRILREMRVDTRAIAQPFELEQVTTPSAEDEVLGSGTPEIEEHTQGLPSTSSTLRIVHASAIHQLLGLPPVASWTLTPRQRQLLKDAIEQDPSLPRKVLSRSTPDTTEPAYAIQSMWAHWRPDEIAEMLAKSTEARDIPHLLCAAAIMPLPRPKARSGELARTRNRVRGQVPAHAEDSLMGALDSFLDTFVDAYTDFDRIRRPLPPEEEARRAASACTFPVLLKDAAHQMGITRLDLLSGLIALFIDPVPVADPDHFTPTPWRFAR